MESIKSKFDEVKYVNLAPARAAAFSCAGNDVGLEEHIERSGGGFIIPVMLPVKKKPSK